jgi:flavin reductase (DIM6/NTAB) family NADH-FMN oxidoreductase RutF
VTIHDTHPFLDPESERDPARRFRGRLGGAVTLWTSGADDDRAGLTVSSLMVAGGEPARIIALLDPDSDLADTLQRTGRAVVHLLGWGHRDLADAFAGVAPAPGGAFRLATFEAGEWGPLLADAPAWAAVSLESEQAVGWSSLVTCIVDDVHLGEDTPPLVHRRGHYLRPTD